MFRDNFSKTFEMCLVLNEKSFTIDKYFSNSTKIYTCLSYRLSQNNIKNHMKYTTKNTDIDLISCNTRNVAHNVSPMKIEIL